MAIPKSDRPFSQPRGGRSCPGRLKAWPVLCRSLGLAQGHQGLDPIWQKKVQVQADSIPDSEGEGPIRLSDPRGKGAPIKVRQPAQDHTVIK